MTSEKLDQWEAEAKDFLRIVKGEMGWCELWTDKDGKEQFEPWYVITSRYLALIAEEDEK